MQSSDPEQLKVKAWYDQYGWILKTCSEDLGALQKSLETNNFPVIPRDAQKLEGTVAIWKDFPPFPVAQVAAPLSAALSSCSACAQYCIDGINNADQELLDRATEEINQCCAYLAQTQARFDEVSAKWNRA